MTKTRKVKGRAATKPHKKREPKRRTPTPSKRFAIEVTFGLWGAEGPSTTSPEGLSYTDVPWVRAVAVDRETLLPVGEVNAVEIGTTWSWSGQKGPSVPVYGVELSYVNKELRGQGLGTALYQAVASAAAKLGAHLASAPSDELSPDSRGFWAKQLAKRRARIVGSREIPEGQRIMLKEAPPPTLRNPSSPRRIERKLREAIGDQELCYPAAEVLYHKAGGKRAGLTPATVQHEGQSHWFVRGPRGEVYDPTAEQFNSPPTYEDGRGRGFLTKKPSRRARELARAVRLNPHGENPRGDLAVRRPGEGGDPKVEAWRRGFMVPPDNVDEAPEWYWEEGNQGDWRAYWYRPGGDSMVMARVQPHAHLLDRAHVEVYALAHGRRLDATLGIGDRPEGLVQIHASVRRDQPPDWLNPRIQEVVQEVYKGGATNPRGYSLEPTIGPMLMNPDPPSCVRCKIELRKLEGSPGWNCSKCMGWYPDSSFVREVCLQCQRSVADKPWAGRANQLCFWCHQARMAKSDRKRREAGKPKKETKRQKKDREARQKKEREQGMGPLFGGNPNPRRGDEGLQELLRHAAVSGDDDAVRAAVAGCLRFQQGMPPWLVRRWWSLSQREQDQEIEVSVAEGRVFRRAGPPHTELELASSVGLPFALHVSRPSGSQRRSMGLYWRDYRSEPYGERPGAWIARVPGYSQTGVVEGCYLIEPQPGLRPDILAAIVRAAGS